jgi:hypothetical protein
VVTAQPPDDMSEYGAVVKLYCRGKTSGLPEKPVPVPNPTWTALVVNAGLRDEKPVTNHLCHGTAIRNIS